MNIELPVSIGEALDKLSILEIKLDKIKDDRRLDVQKEYDTIYLKLKEFFTEDSLFHYRYLKKVNEEIWNMQDEFRSLTEEKKERELKQQIQNLNPESIVQKQINDIKITDLCKKIIHENDRRFQIKKKLNRLFNSSLQEQKGYVKKTAFYYGHLGMGDMINCIGIMRYLSTLYDHVIVVCIEQYIQNMKLMLKDDLSIELYSVKTVNDISMRRVGFPFEKFKEIVGDADIYLAGIEVIDTEPQLVNIPFSFYVDCKIHCSHFWTSFHIAHCIESKELESIVRGMEYVFIHNTDSIGKVFSISAMEERLSISKENILCINVSENVYPVGHKWYDIAQQFIGKPLPYYKDTIMGATHICVSDSSFFCFCLQLDIANAKQCFYVPKQPTDYSYFFNNDVLDNNTSIRRKNQKEFQMWVDFDFN